MVSSLMNKLVKRYIDNIYRRLDVYINYESIDES